MRENLNKCMHNDCFTCPYPDCISNTDPQKHKPGRKRKDPAEKARLHREKQRKWYAEHRDEVKERMSRYYHDHKKK
jgi:hypothetical protein